MRHGLHRRGHGGRHGYRGGSGDSQVAREQEPSRWEWFRGPFEHEGIVKQQGGGGHSEPPAGAGQPDNHSQRQAHVGGGEDATLEDALAMANDVLANAVEGINRIISVPGTINLDFEDVRRVITSGGGAMMGTGVATGPNRAEEAARQAISNPLLDSISIEGARAVLVKSTPHGM